MWLMFYKRVPYSQRYLAVGLALWLVSGLALNKQYDSIKPLPTEDTSVYARTLQAQDISAPSDQCRNVLGPKCRPGSEVS